MDYGRRNTKKYSFRYSDLKELRKISSFVLDPLDFKQYHWKLLSVLSTDVVEGLLSVLVQFYDPLYRCFNFPDYQLVPTLEEYARILGIHVSSKVPFRRLKEIPRSHLIAEALHLKKSEIETHWVKKGGLFGLTYEFLIKEATAFAQAGSVDAFEAIFVLLIYGLAYFPNIDSFVDVNTIRIFLIENHVPTLLGDMYFSLHLRNSKGGGTIVCCVPLLYKKGRSELGLHNCVALEAYTLLVKKRALELKMSYACERPMSMVVAEPLTLPKQDVEELEDALAKMKQERDMWEERFHALSRKHEELQLESKDKDALIELFEDRMSYWLFLCASAKLTHRYNTRVNHPRIMEHLEQENRDLKDEISCLTSMMETVLAAHIQSSPTPATPPPQRTVSFEVSASTIPATAAHFAPTMLAGFPWGMSPNFVPEGFAPTFASMSASSPVMPVPPPIVHTLPRVKDTIYHSDPSEGSDVYEKMDKMKDQFLELRKELKTLRGKYLF
ncbi:hypothetical protein KIW84_032955 [Lathyrus oleraceus]|uniref:DUF7745 domain-containing protein n=1 Tax=Pisum sativum TaxID=3888 RepID=A0A9D4XVC7_PEA|nr:hypothetical protein KIW84_032955 [Pisum sativum]